MTTRETNWPVGTPCWTDVTVPDAEKARTFYSSLFGWDIEEGSPELHGYATCRLDGRRVAGLNPAVSPDQPSEWTVYLATDDVEATTAEVREAGGEVAAGPFDVGGVGRMARVTHPGGAVTGLWQGITHTGFGIVGEPGSLAWSESFSHDRRLSQEFYSRVVGWEYGDLSAPGFEYATCSVDGTVVCGIGQIAQEDLPDGPWMPADRSPRWNVYFAVGDTDGALARVRGLGGTVVREPWVNEFGRFAAVTDDQGVPFLIVQQPRE